jgi:hypothetical protein
MSGLFGGGGGGSSSPAPQLNSTEFQNNSRRMHDGRRGRRTVMTSGMDRSRDRQAFASGESRFGTSTANKQTLGG